ncbi:MAG: LptE family protein [Bacteroidaceae bacterium]
MDLTKLKRNKLAAYFMFTLLLSACSVSYKFNGASINYNVTKTIQIAEFPIRSALVWAPMQTIFNMKLQDAYVNQTRLQLVKRNGDLQISGEITDYNVYNKSISADGLSSQTQLKMTVNVRFVNNKNRTQDFERSFSATSEFESSQQLASVQEELVTQMIKDITDQIFSATVANW